MSGAGTFVLAVMNSTNHTPNTFAAAAVVSLLLVLLPVAAFAATVSDGSSIPIAQGEQSARACYLRAQQQWNRVMSSTPHDRRQLDGSYRAFAGCAKIAITTGKVTRAGERLPWMPEYFADTVGATYAQLQLATVTGNPERCTHLKQARDLAEQASESEGEMGPGNANFESMWQALQQNVRLQTAGCAKIASRP